MGTKQTIIIDLEGGLIQNIHNLPDNIDVIIRDYDIGIEEETETDEDGKEYIEFQY